MTETCQISLRELHKDRKIANIQLLYFQQALFDHQVSSMSKLPSLGICWCEWSGYIVMPKQGRMHYITHQYAMRCVISGVRIDLLLENLLGYRIGKMREISVTTCKYSSFRGMKMIFTRNEMQHPGPPVKRSSRLRCPTVPDNYLRRMSSSERV